MKGFTHDHDEELARRRAARLLGCDEGELERWDTPTCYYLMRKEREA